MIGLLCFVVAVLASAFKSKIRLEAENATLRRQLVVLRRKVKGRAHLTNNDRWFLVQMYRWFPLILEVVTIVQPETLVHWHRAGFRRYWRWQSRRRGGRPPIEAELRALIRQMSTENWLWVRRASTANCSSLGLVSLNQPSPGIWPSDADLQVRDGGRFCETTRQTLPPWTCSWSRPSASNCCTAS